MERTLARMAAFSRNCKAAAAIVAPGRRPSASRAAGDGMGHGEFCVDLLDNRKPSHVAVALNAAAREAAVVDDATPLETAMAFDLIRAAAVVARAFGRTLGGMEWSSEHRERPYSLAFIYALAMDDWPIFQEALEAIRHTLETDYELMADYATSELFDALSSFTDWWLHARNPVRDGIKAEIDKILGPLCGDPTLRRRFASGNGFSISEDPGLSWKLAGLNFSLVEHGASGRLTAAFVKALLRMDAIHKKN